MASPSTGYAVFETAIGPCGLAWRGQQLVRVVLPEANARGTETRLTTLFPDAQPLVPPTWVKRAVHALTASVGGKAVPLDRLPLALDDVPPFHRRVYEAARLIGRGQTLSYVELAKRAGSERASRAVGQAMARNPFPLVVPCHRVLAAGGKVGGFTARDGTTLKARILASEGVRVDPIVAAKPTRSRFNAATRHLQKADPAMAKLIAKVGQCALDLRQLTTTFGALLEAIVYQQLTGKAAATIFGRVQALFDPARFPTPAEIAAAPATTLRAAGLSQAKILAAKDLAAHALRGDLPTLKQLHAMDDADIIAQLTAIRGIGRWTVEMLLIFRLARPDILPSTDYGVRKGFEYTFRCKELPSPKEIEARAERWRPHRSIASWYLWRAADLSKSTRGHVSDGPP